MSLPPLDKVDRTRAFTQVEQEAVNKLPRDKRLAYMRRPESGEAMSDEERAKHYVNKNYPEVKYMPSGSPNPKHMRGVK